MRYERASADLVKFEYAYDDSGNRTQEKKTVGATVTTLDYTYDWFSRLLTVKKNGTLQVTYTYDESDNRATEVRGAVTKTYVYDDADQLVSSTAGAVTENFTHDLDGNMTSRTVSGVTTNYLWDQDMRLKRIDAGSDQLYDAEGYSSGAASIADRGAANLTYVQGHQILASANGATVLYYLHDGLSSVRALADAGGAVTANLDYDEFGAPSSKPHSYVGGLGVRNETSASSKLYYMRQRWYASDLGRFISADPIGFAGGLNLYAYVGNNPINRVDPSGLAYSKSFTPLQMQQIDAAISEIRNQGFKLEADLLSRQQFENGDILLKGDVIGLTWPGSNFMYLRTPGGQGRNKNSSNCWNHVELTQLLFHEAQHLKQKHRGENLYVLGVLGHWAQDPTTKYLLEAEAYGAEHLLSDVWQKTADQTDREAMLKRSNWASLRAESLFQDALNAGMQYPFKH